MNPLGAKIAKAKVGVLDINPDLLREAVGALVDKVESASTSFPKDLDQFAPSRIDEICRWFPSPVISKLNWLLRCIRSVSDGIVRDFLEVVLSSILRAVSHQDPNDLRIRKRRNPLGDADVSRALSRCT